MLIYLLGLDLQSLMIMPVQRIPRYSLLLKDLLSKTSQHHKDYENLKKALGMINETADFINKKMKEYENFLKVQEIASNYDIQIITPSRFFKKEDKLKLYVNGSLEERITYLFNDSILFIQVKKDKMLNSKLIEFEKVPFPWILDIPNEKEFPNSFHFVLDKETCILSFETMDQKNNWIAELEKVLNDLLDKSKEYKTNRADLTPQIITREDKKRSFSFFGNNDKFIYPIKRKELVSLEDAKKVTKGLGLCRSIETHETKALDDELTIREGDIMEILVKGVKDSSIEWLICKKIGISCDPTIKNQVKYSNFVDLLSKEKKKKIISPNVISLVENQPIFIPKKIVNYDDSFFKCLYNNDESNQIGLVPVKAVVIFDENTATKIMEVKIEKDKIEEKKFRNFSIIKK